MCVTMDICVAGVKESKLTMLRRLCKKQPCGYTGLVPEPGPDEVGMRRTLRAVLRKGISVLANPSGPSSPHIPLGPA